MIHRIFKSSLVMQYSLLPMPLRFGFAGFEPRVDHSLVSNINQFRSFEQLFSYYDQNKVSFNPYLYSVFCRKLTRLLKDRVISKGARLNNKTSFKVFLQQITQLDFQLIGPSQIKSMLFMNRTFKSNPNYIPQLFNPFELKLTKRVKDLVAQDRFTNINQLIAVFYDLSGFSDDVNAIVAKIQHLLVSKQEYLVHQRNKIEPYHLFLVLKAFTNRYRISKQDQKVISQFYRFINEKVSQIPLTDAVKIMNCVNQLRLNKNVKIGKKVILNRLIDLVLQNINELQINSIFNILMFKSEQQDNAYSKIYQLILDNLFNSISENGQSFIEPKVFFDCLRQLSTKKHLIKRPPKQQWSRLLLFIDRQISKNDRKLTFTVTREVGVLFKTDYLSQTTIKELYQILMKYTDRQINFKLICEMSEKKFDMSAFFKHIEQVDISKNLLYFVEMASAIKGQSEINPNNQHIKNLLSSIKKQAQTINISDLRNMAFTRQSRVVFKFHRFFSDLYMSNISKQQLMNKDNLNWYIRFLVVVTNSRERVLHQLGQFNNQLEQSLTIFFKTIERNQWATNQLFNILLIIQDIIKPSIEKKSWNLLFFITRFLSCSQVKAQTANVKFFQAYCKILKQFSNNLLPISQSNNILQFFFQRIDQGRSRRIVSSLQYLSFLSECKEHVFNIKEQRNKYAISVALLKFNLLSQKQLKELGFQSSNRLQSESENSNKLYTDKIRNYLNSQTQISQSQRQKIIKAITTMYNVQDIEQSIIRCRIPNTPKNRQILEKLVEQLILVRPRWQNVKIFSIFNSLKNRYRMFYSKTFKTLLKDIVDKIIEYNGIPNFTAKQHCSIINKCLKAGLQISTYIDLVQKNFVQFNIKKEKQLQFLLTVSNKSLPQFIRLIDGFSPRKALWLTIIAGNQIENPESKLKSYIQKLKVSNQQLDWLQRKYISKKYPALKQLLGNEQSPKQIIQRPQQQEIETFKKLESSGLAQVKKTQMDKLNSYYQVNGTAVLLNRNRTFSGASETSVILSERLLSEILGKPVILYNKRADLLKKLIQKSPELEKLKKQLLDEKNIQQEDLQQVIDIIEESSEDPLIENTKQ